MSSKKLVPIKNVPARIALSGMLTALAFVLGYVESLVPFYLGVWGVKLGLANLVTLVCLYCIGVKSAILISLIRVVLSGLTFSPPSTILFGLAGAGLSLSVMYVCKKYNLFGMVGVSILGGVAHNIGQLLVMVLVMNTLGIFSYLPVLLASGTAAGAVVGLLGGVLVSRVGHVIKNI